MQGRSYIINAFFRAKVVLFILVALHALDGASCCTGSCRTDRDGRAGSGETGCLPAAVVDRYRASWARIGYIELPFGIHA